ncbi:SIMPL domain-containing protein [Xanthomonas massiliensis]|jgi:uncharacterized protein YggE|uniref:SIMPL domain-containing protein n=1 Tax=Xanthomonas massiliensis TaxID=1720302 RepID=UPI00082560C5|nr:SIMPL domain-containing protein [Xanthomonas massiliensis]
MHKTPLRPLLLALALALGAPMTTFAQSAATAPLAADATQLNVSVQAEVSRVPDVAGLSAGVVTQAADGNAAMRQNAEQMSRVMAALRAAGIAERDVQTSGVRLAPQYRYAQGKAPAITGYQATNTVRVKVRDIAGLGKVLDALAANGANQINGPSFDIDDPAPLYDQARQDAVRQAQRRAELYAKALGLRVRRVVSIAESGGARPMPVMMMARAAAAPEADTPVAPGETTLSVNLDVTFELGR